MYLSLQFSDEQTLEDLARLVAVADVLEGFGRILAAYVEEDFLAAAVISGSVLWFLWGGWSWHWCCVGC